MQALQGSLGFTWMLSLLALHIIECTFDFFLSLALALGCRYSHIFSARILSTRTDTWRGCLEDHLMSRFEQGDECVIVLCRGNHKCGIRTNCHITSLDFSSCSFICASVKWWLTSVWYTLWQVVRPLYIEPKVFGWSPGPDKSSLSFSQNIQKVSDEQIFNERFWSDLFWVLITA